MRAGMTALVLATGLLSAAVTPVPGAAAHEPPAVHGTEEPTVIAALRAKGARVLALGERGGLSGHFVELGDGDAYGLYVTPDGHAVAGLLYGPDGTLLTGDQIAAAGGRGDANKDVLGDEASVLAHAYAGESYRPDVEASDTEVYTEVHTSVLFERSASAFGFTLGHTGPLVVLFADPGCRWSRAAVARLGGPALDGRLRLRVVPVGVLGAASAREAIAIASAPDPAMAWFEGDGCGGQRGRRAADCAQQWPVRRLGPRLGAPDRLASARRRHLLPSRRPRRHRGLARGAPP